MKDILSVSVNFSDLIQLNADVRKNAQVCFTHAKKKPNVVTGDA